MNEQNEIRGDEREDAQEDLERIDAWENAPESHPPTDAELEDMFRDSEGVDYEDILDDDGDIDIQERYDSWKESFDRDTEEHQEEMSRILDETYPTD